MKILNVIATLDPVKGGGSVERTFQMSHSLVKSGAECGILTTDLGLTPERLSSLRGIKVVALPCFNKRFYLPKFSWSKLRNTISYFDIIHLMNHWTFLNILVYFSARQLHKPYVICAAGSLPVYGRSKALKIMYNLFIGKMIVRNATFCIAITQDEVGHYQSYGVAAERIVVIPNGITADKLIVKDDAIFRKKFKLSDKRIILYAGRLNYIKGPDLLLKAYSNLKEVLSDWQLIYIGPDGGMLSELKKIRDTNGLRDRIHFLGYLDGNDKSYAYNAAELLVIPSRQEAMSIVVLEAGITGKPVLITEQCGFSMIENIKGGRVVPVSVEKIQQGLMELLSQQSALKLMGDNLRKFVEEQFLWDVIIDRYIKLYRSILSI